VGAILSTTAPSIRMKSADFRQLEDPLVGSFTRKT
jgi:hypothetical protein